MKALKVLLHCLVPLDMQNYSSKYISDQKIDIA